MKKFIPYRDIRKEALIFGLPVYLFAVQMIAVIIGLLIIIFAFGWMTLIIGCSSNILLYLILMNLKKLMANLQFFHVFPKHLSTKQITVFHQKLIEPYESL
ncbi:hypothetical protein [Zunongwangia sp. HGR-M22]|uniref:hypothetical protein n=1 Tax=Zunongwangia sp. HGR-M22 TaxID=3015168 RepID=UPI0022DDCBFD|nr:hypothetical protein [Zunongwangia sp. HGR-M22]WBL26726.1 hypothetical protein PBT91_05505 [Zunongwangia sp. HGR-M22]